MTRKPKNTAKADAVRALREQQAEPTGDSARVKRINKSMTVIDISGLAIEEAHALIARANEPEAPTTSGPRDYELETLEDVIAAPNPTQPSSSFVDDAAASGGPVAVDEVEPTVHIEVDALAEANQRVLDAEVEEATWVGPTKGAASDHAPYEILHALGVLVGQYVKAQCCTDAFNVVFRFRTGAEPDAPPVNPTRCVRCIAIIRGEPVPEHAPTAPARNGTAGPIRRKASTEARTPGRTRAAKPKLIKAKTPQDVSLLLRKLKAGEKLDETEIAAAVAVLEARAGG